MASIATITVPVRVRLIGLTRAQWQAWVCWLIGVKVQAEATMEKTA